MIKKCDLCGVLGHVISKRGVFVCDNCKDKLEPSKENICGKM